MSSSVTVSPKYGLNPTIQICFWCGKDRGEIALMGRMGDGRKHEDLEAPMYSIIDFEPCDECKKKMSTGFTLIEVTAKPNAYCAASICSGAYPTGRCVVVNPDAVKRWFGDESASVGGKAFLESFVFQKMFMPGDEC